MCHLLGNSVRYLGDSGQVLTEAGFHFWPCCFFIVDCLLARYLLLETVVVESVKWVDFQRLVCLTILTILVIINSVCIIEHHSLCQLRFEIFDRHWLRAFKFVGAGWGEVMILFTFAATVCRCLRVDEGALVCFRDSVLGWLNFICLHLNLWLNATMGPLLTQKDT